MPEAGGVITAVLTLGRNKFPAQGSEGFCPAGNPRLPLPARHGFGCLSQGLRRPSLFLGGERQVVSFRVGGTKKKALQSGNRNTYDSLVRHFIPFCCEESRKLYCTSHTGEPLAKRTAGRRNSGVQLCCLHFPALPSGPSA